MNLYKILTMYSRRYQEPILKRNRTKNNYIVRSGDGKFEWVTLRFSRMNRRIDGGDRGLQWMRNAMHHLAMNSHGPNFKSPHGVKKRERGWR